MNEETNAVISQLRADSLNYASAREEFKRAGRETPELAALITEKYCAGIVSAVRVIAGPSAAHSLIEDVRRELARLDPEWQSNVGTASRRSPCGFVLLSPSKLHCKGPERPGAARVLRNL
jgi:hypothetical protein